MNIRLKCGVFTIEKFKIPVVPRTTNRSIRFPNDVLAGVDKAIADKDCTFTAFVVEAVRVALRNVEETNERGEDSTGEEQQ